MQLSGICDIRLGASSLRPTFPGRLRLLSSRSAHPHWESHRERQLLAQVPSPGVLISGLNVKKNIFL
jgi:hypothetical protein